jgi:dihydrofolate reductase
VGSVLLDVTMSLDGFITGPNAGVDLPLGEGGLRLHAWMTRPGPRQGIDWHQTAASEVDARVKHELFARAGAVVMGRRSFDVGIGPWADTPFPVPCFVVTHRAREDLVEPSGTFTFVTEGTERAVQRARAAAGERDVCLMGADIAQQCLTAGLLDELHLHVAPMLIGDGRRLFGRPGAGHIELEPTSVIQSPHVTHLRFRVVTQEPP